MGRLDDARRRRPTPPSAPTSEVSVEQAAQARQEDIAFLDPLLQRTRDAILRRCSARRYWNLYWSEHSPRWKAQARTVPRDKVGFIFTHHSLGPGVKLLLGREPVAIVEVQPSASARNVGFLHIHLELRLWEVGGWNRGSADHAVVPPEWMRFLSNRQRKARDIAKEVEFYQNQNRKLDEFRTSLIDQVEQMVTITLDALGIPDAEVEG